MREGTEVPERDVLYKKMLITVKGHEPMVLKSYETFVKHVCDNLALTLKSETRNRPKFLRLSMNRSPFVFKKKQRQYEFRTHYKYFTVDHITGCTADVFLEYIQRNLPEGVAMEVEKVRRIRFRIFRHYGMLLRTLVNSVELSLLLALKIIVFIFDRFYVRQ
ncbi:28S ribosomal protein S10 isoform 1 [Schistosoma japonicum]|uniref:Small ribosomal subunit protein uS10m n=1 Tax=Schistosoma japonicum TaxID=6182 RepID=A0A4Z2CU33_SCHJA|nr:28S ribosomal protein S10 isoform 1 [Schistosoma japonicum]